MNTLPRTWNHLYSLRLPLLAGLLVFLAGFGAVAFRSAQAPDIFTDEIIYTRAAIRTGAEGALVWDSGAPFMVHPPLYFLLSGMYFNLTGPADTPLYAPGDIFTSVFHARLLNAFLAGLTGLLVLAFTYRLAHPLPPLPRLGLSLAAAGLFVLDPFGIRTNRRAMLETLSMLLTLAGMLAYTGVLPINGQAKKDGLRSGFALRGCGLLAGVLLGLALLTKELVFIHLLGLALFAAWETTQELWRSHRSVAGKTALLRRLLHMPALVNAAAALALAAGTYLIYPLWVFSTGGWSEFWEEKSLGVLRLLGLVQLTGWNREGVSFFSLFVQRLMDYGSTYLLLALGGAAAAWLVLVGVRRAEAVTPRFLAAWGLTIYPFFAFLMLFGTGNDQFFYFLLAPAVLMSMLGLLQVSRLVGAGAKRRTLSEAQALEALAGKLPAHKTPRPASTPLRLPRLARGLARLSPVLLLALLLPVGLFQWSRQYGLASDNGYTQLAGFVQDNLPPGEAINASGDPIKFAYFFPERPVYALAEPTQAQAAGLRYFVLAPKDVALRYGRITPELADWIQANGQPVFSFRGSSYGDVYLYQVANPSAAANSDPPAPFNRRFQVAQGGAVDGFLEMLLLWLAAWAVMGLFVQRLVGPGNSGSPQVEA